MVEDKEVMKFSIFNFQFSISILILALLICSGCQKMIPKLPEEKETTIEEILARPQDFQEVEIKLTGVLKASKEKGLKLIDKDFEIKVSTESSGIAPADFVNEKVEVGGVLKGGVKELTLEMGWVGILPKSQAREIAIEKKAALASVLKVDEGEIEVVSTEVVDWPDSSLGAPEEGKMYMQVITPGFKIIYKAQGKTYEVHTNQDGTLAVLIKPRTEL